jgi:hypothetical protein
MPATSTPRSPQRPGRDWALAPAQPVETRGMSPDPRRAAKRVRAQRSRLTDRVSRLASPSGRQLASVGRQSSW